jgi:hypothetical protein
MSSLQLVPKISRLYLPSFHHSIAADVTAPVAQPAQTSWRTSTLDLHGLDESARRECCYLPSVLVSAVIALVALAQPA